ncbi:hypothetical protein MSVAZ_2251 [Methanosarcina vacuolata Z-761]|uniref:Peptidase M48 domain-containing protein n=2 Tax=Methanosarcina vacuolata TaxID=2215 RepID=A0A0E3Q4Y1_9EURY|nr:hypothetical protein MSVAZ_2251 [Methanosarcina vacuolata Z-761]
MLQKNCALPPWLWFWLISYLLMFPIELNYWKSYSIDLIYVSDPLFLANIPELLPSLALFLGVITVFFPKIRAHRLERRFSLVEKNSALLKLPERMKQTGADIEYFLKVHVPNIQIKANFGLFNQNCFLYTSGYHKTSLALFGGILILWKLDRKVAESILLHEIGHYRNGDAFIIGAGSFFEWVLRHCLIITTLFFIIPFIWNMTNQEVTFFSNNVNQELIFLDIMKDNGMPIKEIIFSFLTFLFSTIIYRFKYHLFVTLPGILLPIFWLLLWTINTFIPPIAGIWCAEMNADRFMKRKSTSPDAPAKALDRISEDVSIVNWLISQVSHPPKWLRKWAIKDTKKKESTLVFLLIFPLAYFITLVEPFVRVLTTYSIGERKITDALEVLDISTGNYLRIVYNIWLFSAFFILLWPTMSVYWINFFSGKVELPNWEDYNEYILGAGVVFCLFILGYFIA